MNKIDTKALREKILDLAMRGKLVPQDPNDEPASILLENIKKEKEQLVKDKVIKKQKPLPPIEKEEEPFEIPDSWEWVRLGDIYIDNLGGGTPSKSQSKYWNGNIPWASVKDLKSNFLHESIDSITELGLNNSSTNLIPANTLIIATRMAIGKITENTVPLAINQDLRALFFHDDILKKYIKFIYPMLKFETKGITVKGISLSILNNKLISLPPLPEQQRIVSKIEELFVELDKIDKAQETYDNAANKLSWTYLRNQSANYVKVQLSKIIKNIRIPKDKKIDISEVNSCGRYPVITQSKKSIIGYQDNDEKIFHPEKTYILFGDHTKEVKYIDFAFSLSGDGVKLLECTSDLINMEYLYFSIQFIANNLGDRGYRRYFSLLKNESVSVPPLEVQLEIVKSLKVIESLI